MSLKIIKKGYEIDHINGDKDYEKYNWLENIRILSKKDHEKKTRKENPDHGKIIGKKTEKKIVAIHISTGEKQDFDSITQAAEVLNLKGTSITRVMKGTGKRKVTKTGNYTFEYKEMENLKGEIWKDVTSDIINFYEKRREYLKSKRSDM